MRISPRIILILSSGPLSPSNFRPGRSTENHAKKLLTGGVYAGNKWVPRFLFRARKRRIPESVAISSRKLSFFLLAQNVFQGSDLPKLKPMLKSSIMAMSYSLAKALSSRAWQKLEQMRKMEIMNSDLEPWNPTTFSVGAGVLYSKFLLCLRINVVNVFNYCFPLQVKVQKGKEL